jgi:hypothetical protein
VPPDFPGEVTEEHIRAFAARTVSSALHIRSGYVHVKDDLVPQPARLVSIPPMVYAGSTRSKCLGLRESDLYPDPELTKGHEQTSATWLLRTGAHGYPLHGQALGPAKCDIYSETPIEDPLFRLNGVQDYYP